MNDHLNLLSNVRVTRIPANVSENVRGHNDVVAIESLSGFTKKAANRLHAIIPIVGLRKSEPARIRESHIVELNFMEAFVSGLFGNIQVVIPNVGLKRIRPG